MPSNPIKENSFNSLVDIETNAPILTVPVKCCVTDNVQGAFQVVNTRGIEGLSSTGVSKITSRDSEMVECFAKNLAQTIQKLKDYEEECNLGV